MAKGGLSRWFDEKWVDLSRPKEGGGFEPCGRPDAEEGKYPKCVPASRAARMTPEEIASAIRRKRRAESTERREGQKPINVPTLKKAHSNKRGISSIPAPTVSKKNIPTDMELYNRVKAEAKRKFDVYPSAYANGWLVQEYKRRGGKYKTVVSKHGQHNQPISKDSPTVNAVHVPTTGKRRKRDLRRKKMRMEAALKAAKVAKHAEHNQKAHGNRSFARGGAGMLGRNLGSVGEVGFIKESNTQQKNTNPMTSEARANLKNVGERVSLEEMQEQRAKLIERYESLPKATKIQKDRYCKETKAGGRQGGELGRGNNKVRSRRKMRLLKDFGDGHTAGCAYCGIRVDYKSIEVEKLDPVVGYTDDRNLAPSCRGCNSSMGNKPVSKKTGRTFTRKFTKPRC